MYTEKQITAYNQQTNQLLSQLNLLSSNKKETKQIATQLRSLLNYHDWRYYTLSDPVLKDVDYDYLFDTLKAIEKQFPDLQTPDSPTQRVAKGLSADFTSVAHTVPMLSLDKAYQDADLRDWDDSIKKLVEEQQITYIVEPKFDGSSIALIYENDLLVRGATRGNGTMGDDITANIKTLPTIPLATKFSQHEIQKIELRGEVVIHKEKFAKLNEERIQKGEKLLANARNSAAGALRLKDASRVMERKLEAFIYQIGYAIDAQGEDRLGEQGIDSQSEAIKLLYEQGFKTPLKNRNDRSHVCQNIEEVIAYCNEWRAKRNAYPYEIDGMVIKVDNIKLQGLAGATGHHPRWAIALKFDAREAETILENVDFQVGRTGAITPVAKLQTVNLSGANISNTSLHNEDFIAEKDIRIGDTVVVVRAGDVIPYIKSVITENRTGIEKPVVFPTTCPSCQSEIVKPEGESVWRCLNPDCPAQVGERIIHYVSKNAMDIRGLGKKIVESFIAKGFIKRIPDIYQLPFQQIRTLEGWGTKSVANLQNSIETSKNQALHRLLIGLGIREVGQSTAKTLESVIEQLTDLQQFTLEQLTALPDIGEKVANNIIDFFQNPKNIALIQTLQQLGVNTKKRASEQVTGEAAAWSGKKFVFTGTLQTLKRSEAKKMVEDKGGQVISTVSKNVDYLVAGEKAGSKLRKAQKIDSIRIMSEADFLEMAK